jgi:oligoribonuclease (3'-5' exoribonuclease)
VKPVVILDLETTGLDVEKGATILEVGALHIDLQSLEVLSQFHRLRHMEDPEVLMEEVVREMHTSNGLIAAVQRTPSSESVCESLAELDQDFEEWLIRCGGGPRKVLLCGYTIHFDARFIETLLPRTHAMRHYRLLDVRSALILAEAWGRGVYPGDIVSTHRALEDCDHVLAAMRWLKACGT